MKTAGWLAIVLGVVLGVMGISDIREDALNAADGTNRGFEELRSHDYASLEQDHRDSLDRQATEQHEFLGAAVFIIAGIALIGAGSRKPHNVGAAE